MLWAKAIRTLWGDRFGRREGEPGDVAFPFLFFGAVRAEGDVLTLPTHFAEVMMEPENSSESSSEKRSETVQSDATKSETVKLSEKSPRATAPLSPLTEARLALKHLERREWRAGRLADLLRNLVEMLEIRERLDSASERQLWELSATGEFLFDSDTAPTILRPLPKTLDEFLGRMTDPTERDAVTEWFREIQNAPPNQMYRKDFLFRGETLRFFAVFSDFSGGVRRLVGVMERINDGVL